VIAAVAGVTVTAVAEMVTIWVAVALPPVPVHTRVEVVVAARAPVLTVPAVARVPASAPPVPTHEVAFVDDQVSVEAPPPAMTDGVALSAAVTADVTGTTTGGVTTGGVTATGAATVTVAMAAGLWPPAPLQVIVKPASAVSGPELCEPLTPSAPDHPPDAAQAVAPVDAQVNVDAAPGVTVVGDAVNVTVGVGATVTVAVAAVLVPPAPVHVRENVVSTVRAAESWVPDVARGPVQPPVAVHEVAPVEVHDKAGVPPLATVVGETVREAVGSGAGASLPPPHAAKALVTSNVEMNLMKRIPSLYLNGIVAF
jgi:hypothetical protein